MKHFKSILAVALSLSMVAALAGCGSSSSSSDTTAAQTQAAEETESVQETTAQAAEETAELVGAKAIGFVDADGAKINAVVFEYGAVIKADSVSEDSFAVTTYDVINESSLELGEDPGQITKVYANDEAAVAESGKDGKYVIVEVNSDFQRGSVPKYDAAMIFDAEQTGEIETVSGEKIAASESISNYTVEEVEQTRPNGETVMQKQFTIEDGTYEITNIADYQLFPIGDGAFHATNCQEEALSGEGAAQETVDVDLPYALYVPEDYQEGGNYGLVLQIEDAGALGEDPMIALTESQACANFASEEVQQMAKDAGMDGLFVLTPQISEELRSTRDNYTISAAVPATWQLLDYITEEYDINMDRIFATGQSMGGMQVICMAAQRDNYFAGIWENGCQWGTNYNKEEPYPERGGSYGYYTMSTDETIWSEDADGNPTDYGQNWFYLISDDNLLISNCQGDAFSTTVWTELKYLYSDIAGVEIPYTAFNPLEDSLDVQNQAIKDVVATENGDFGFYWYAYNGGSHMLTWVYGHKLDAAYEWLVNQTRETEQSRSKLEDLNRTWVAETDEAKIAEKQTEERSIGELSDGTPVYFAVPAEGAGTIGYNSAWFGMQGTLADDAHGPGWTPAQ